MKVTEISQDTQNFFESIYPGIWKKYQDGDLFATGQVEMYNLANTLRTNEINKLSLDKMHLERLVSLLAYKQDISKYIEAIAKDWCSDDEEGYEKIKKQLHFPRWAVANIKID